MPELISKNEKNDSILLPKKSLRVVICGIRGIPACYGGFETFAEELSFRLCQRGHQVTVYGRSNHIKQPLEEYRGVKIRLLPAPRHKYLETPLHTLLCLFDLRWKKTDVVLVCNAANSPFIWLARVFKQRVVVNVDGIERMRAKWNFLGRWWYRLGEVCSVLFANRLVADADVIRQYYLQHYNCDSVVIRYGHRECPADVLQQKLESSGKLGFLEGRAIYSQLGLIPGEYLLYVSRLEPENNAHIVIEAYNRLEAELKSKRPLVIVGDAPYAREYIEKLKNLAQNNVIFAGYRFGDDYRDLQLGAYAYIQATEVGGTHPALVEAFGFANCVIANDTAENKEVVGSAGLLYAKNDAADLARRLTSVLTDERLVAELRNKAVIRAKEHFSWEKITNLYEQLFFDLAAKSAVRN